MVSKNQKSYLVDIHCIHENYGFSVIVMAENKKQAHIGLRKIYSYKSYKHGYSIYFQRNNPKLIIL